jgi:hypothetical protein
MIFIPWYLLLYISCVCPCIWQPGYCRVCKLRFLIISFKITSRTSNRLQLLSVEYCIYKANIRRITRILGQPYQSAMMKFPLPEVSFMLCIQLLSIFFISKFSCISQSVEIPFSVNRISKCVRKIPFLLYTSNDLNLSPYSHTFCSKQKIQFSHNSRLPGISMILRYTRVCFVATYVSFICFKVAESCITRFIKH